MANNRKPRTYHEAGFTWLRQIEGYEPPQAGEVAIRMPWVDITDYLAAESFNEDAIEMGELWGGEFHYPEVIRAEANHV